MKPGRQLANPSERLSSPLMSPRRSGDGGCQRKPTDIWTHREGAENTIAATSTGAWTRQDDRWVIQTIQSELREKSQQSDNGQINTGSYKGEAKEVTRTRCGTRWANEQRNKEGGETITLTIRTWRAVKTNHAHDTTTQRQQEQVMRPETRHTHNRRATGKCIKTRLQRQKII